MINSNIPDNLKYYFDFRDCCWREHKSYKDIKDRILFFIGTIFTTAFIGTGYLILQPVTETTNYVYLMQYILLHMLFSVLYLYYTYNRIISDMYLHEVKCCEKFILKAMNNTEFIPFSHVKGYYIYTKEGKYGGKRFKYAANIVLVVLLAV